MLLNDIVSTTMVSPKYIRPFMALLVIAALFGIAALVFRNVSSGPVTARPASQQLPRNIDVALKQARFSEIQDGVVVWKLVAGRVYYDKTGDVAYLSEISMDFPRNSSPGLITVTADNGEYSSRAKTVRLNGHVHVVTEDGASFETGSITYAKVQDQLSTADPVIFRQKKMQLSAVGMDLRVSDQRAHFHSLVNASIVLN